jgi:hypothetical protein
MAMRVSVWMKALCIGLLAGAAALSTTPSQAGIVVGDYIRFFDHEGTTGGGEFGVAVLPDANTEVFRTFCMQLDEDQDFDPAGFKVVDISDRVQGNGPDDPLDARTAYLYTKFHNGTLSSYDYTPGSAGHVASANALQMAFWAIEGEIGSVSGQALTWINEAAAAISGGSWSGIGNVRVLSLEWTDGHNKHLGEGDAAQDVLTIVPEPASFAVWGLLGVTCLAAGWKRRKRIAG